MRIILALLLLSLEAVAGQDSLDPFAVDNKSSTADPFAPAKSLPNEDRKVSFSQHAVKADKSISLPWIGHQRYLRICKMSVNGERLSFCFSVSEVPDDMAKSKESVDELLKRLKSEEVYQTVISVQMSQAAELRSIVAKFLEWYKVAEAEHVQPFRKTIRNIDFHEYYFDWDGKKGWLSIMIGKQEAEMITALFKDYETLVKEFKTKSEKAAKESQLFK